MGAENKPNGPLDQFQQNVVRSVNAVLSRIDVDAYVLPDTVRERALHVLSYALNVPAAWDYTGQLLLVMAPKMEQAGYRDEWIPYLERGVGLSQVQGDVGGEGELCLQIGYLYLLRSKFSEAQDWFERSLQCFEQVCDLSGQGHAFNRLAMVAVRKEQYADAVKFAGMGLALLDSEHPEQANSYFVLGAVAEGQFLWEEAEQNYRKSLKFWERNYDNRRVAWGLRNLGPALRGQGKYDEAITCYEQAIQLLQEVHDPVNHSIVLMNLGNVYGQYEQPSKALELYLVAEKSLRTVQDRLNLAKIYVNTGIVYGLLDKLECAEYKCLMSIRLWEELGNIASLCNAIDVLGEIYLKQKRFQKAEHTFSEALKWLKQIEGQPRYKRLYNSLIKHLDEAKKGNGG